MLYSFYCKCTKLYDICINLRKSGETIILEPRKKDFQLLADEIKNLIEIHGNKIISSSVVDNILSITTDNEDTEYVLNNLNIKFDKNKISTNGIEQYIFNIKFESENNNLSSIYQLYDNSIPTKEKEKIINISINIDDKIITNNAIKICCLGFIGNNPDNIIKYQDKIVKYKENNLLIIDTIFDSYNSSSFIKLVQMHHGSLFLSLSKFGYETLLLYQRKNKNQKNLIGVVLNDEVYEILDLNKTTLNSSILISSSINKDIIKSANGLCDLIQKKSSKYDINDEIELLYFLLIMFFVILCCILFILKRRKKIFILALGCAINLSFFYYDFHHTYTIGSILLQLIIACSTLNKNSYIYKMCILIISLLSIALLPNNVYIFAWGHIIINQALIAIIAEFFTKNLIFPKEISKNLDNKQ